MMCKDILRDLFDKDDGMSIRLGKVPIGATDFGVLNGMHMLMNLNLLTYQNLICRMILMKSKDLYLFFSELSR